MAEKVASCIDDVDSVLVIVNTKRMARDVFREVCNLIDDSVDAYHLSTNMCPTHRREVMKRMKQSLASKKTVCISTQLIEAGVDVDFNVVIRSLAGLDSIAQAAGRCNRNGKLPAGDIFVMKTDENLSKLEDILHGGHFAEIVINRGYHDILSPDAMSEYFKLYFRDQKSQMNYPTELTGSGLVDLLSLNRFASQTFMTINKSSPQVYLRQSFRTANDEFKVIEENECVIVPYDDAARDLIDKLLSGTYDDPRALMKRLQQYSVNVYNLDRMLSKGIIHEAIPDSGIFLLGDEYYDGELGLVEERISRSMIYRGVRWKTESSIDCGAGVLSLLTR